ncbi:MAG: hypothetical protein GX316_02180 [Firmicutes bacterium]|nr:hypothetical protein [Bacillota bacterium]
MKRFVLGVDGGGTHTQCTLFDVGANKVDMLDWGPTNHEVLPGGFQQLKQELGEMIDTLCRKHKIAPRNIVSAGFGMAGVDTKLQDKIIGEMITELGIENFVLANDAYLGVKAGCPAGVGICVINGTGATVAGINSKREMVQIGGQGHLTGDVGGGGNISTAAVRDVYDCLFRDGPYTIMIDMLFERLKISSKHDYMDAVTESLREPGTRTEYAKMVFEAANQNDQVALDILQFIGRELGRSVNGTIRELEFHDVDVIDVVLAGSVNVKGSNPALVDAIKEEVILKNPTREMNFIVLHHPPVAGAVIWALEGVYQGQDLFEKVLAQLN